MPETKSKPDLCLIFRTKNSRRCVGRIAEIGLSIPNLFCQVYTCIALNWRADLALWRGSKIVITR